MNNTILFIDNDLDHVEKMKDLLEQNGYTVYFALSVSKGLELFGKHQPKLLFLEIDLPEQDGIEVCNELRKNNRNQLLYIVFLSKRNDTYIQISAYNAGADDFLFKPVSERLLLTKIKSYFRRASVTNHETTIVGNPVMKIDFEKYLVLIGDNEIELPKKEFEIITLLFNNPRKVFSRDEIKNKIWGHNGDVKNRTIDVHVKKLREKIGDRFIKTIKGVGYKLDQN